MPGPYQHESACLNLPGKSDRDALWSGTTPASSAILQSASRCGGETDRKKVCSTIRLYEGLAAPRFSRRSEADCQCEPGRLKRSLRLERVERDLLLSSQVVFYGQQKCHST